MGSKDKTERRPCGCLYIGGVRIATCRQHR